MKLIVDIEIDGVVPYRICWNIFEFGLLMHFMVWSRFRDMVSIRKHWVACPEHTIYLFTVQRSSVLDFSTYKSPLTYPSNANRFQ